MFSTPTVFSCCIGIVPGSFLATPIGETAKGCAPTFGLLFAEESLEVFRGILSVLESDSLSESLSDDEDESQVPFAEDL